MNYLPLFIGIITTIIVAIAGLAWLFSSKRALKQLPFVKNIQSNFLTKLPGKLSLKKVKNAQPYVEIRPLPSNDCPSDDILEPLGSLSGEEKLISLGTPITHLIDIAGSASDIATELANGQMYEVLIEPGKELITSKKHPGYQLGSCKDVDGNGRITGQALIRKAPINKRRISTDCIRITGQVASIIADKYYLERICNEMHKLTEEVHKIAEFQITEYQSRIATLVTEGRRIALLLSKETPESTLHHSMHCATVNHLFTECVSALNQSTLTLNKLLKKYQSTQTLSPECYYSATQEINEWVTYQETLMNVLRHIHELKNRLGFGGESEWNATEEIYLNLEMLHQVAEFHKFHVQNLNINLDREVIRSNKWYTFFLDWLLGTQYEALPTGISFKIHHQITAHATAQELIAKPTLYNQPQRLIIKNGMVYRIMNTESNAECTVNKGSLTKGNSNLKF